jgi:cytochrome c oxidase subunit III
MADAATPHTAEHDSAHPRYLAHHFADIGQQFEAGTLGMWVFLVTEIMFFGGLFAAYAIYRHLYLAGFEEGSRLLNVRIGALNTAVLIGSSLTMALAVRAAQLNRRKALIVCLILTMILGVAFIGVKLNFEWRADYEEHLIPGFGFAHPGENAQAVELFFCFYFFMTSLHALHMVIGLGIMTVLVWMASRGRFDDGYYSPIEITGLYWHFVDIVWIFLFPLLYLVGGRY